MSDFSLPSFGNYSPSAQVSQLQTFLQKQGVNVGPTGVDGYFGKNTLRGLKSYEKANGLNDSQVASKVQQMLNSDSFESPAQKGSRVSGRALPPGQLPSLNGAPPPRTQGSAAVGANAAPKAGSYYRQMDPRWQWLNIGNPDSHMGNAGCGPTAIANALGMTPPEVVAKIKAGGGFSRKELSSFDNDKGMAAIGGTLKWNATNADIAKQIDAGKPVVLGVTHSGDQGHYITLLPNGRNGNTYTAVDPAGGRVFQMHANPNGTMTGTGWRAYVSRPKAIFF